MRVVVLCNSISGRGIGRRSVEELAQRLTLSGHEAVLHDVRRGVARDDDLLAKLDGADALVIAGGDGTVHHAASLLLETSVPVVHFPTGTENLFAREFGHMRDPSSIVRALETAACRRIDVGLCDSRPFLLMASVGFDSCIVERIASRRTGAISRWTYLRHAAAEFIQPRFVPLTVTIDGRETIRGEPGMFIVANSRQYAARLDPARSASMTDGEFDTLFLPMDSRLSILRRAVQVFSGRHVGGAGIPAVRGREVVIRPHAAVPLQLDGEHAGTLAPGTEVRCSIRRSALSVLTSG